MLFKNIQNGRAVQITRQAREAQYRNFMLPALHRYDPQAHANIMQHMNDYLDVEANRRNGVTAKQIAVAGPGNTWFPQYDPIYECMDFGNPDEQFANAGKFLGLMLFEVMLNREDEWHTVKYQTAQRYDVESDSYEDYYVTHYFSLPDNIHVKMAERRYENNVRHRGQSESVQSLAEQLTNNWRKGLR